MPPKAKKNSLQYNQMILKQRTEKPNLNINTGDEKHCDLIDDDSFDESNLKGRTPAGATHRKSSINSTPKSNIIEPGKIFSMRKNTNTPASAGIRGLMGSLTSSAFNSRKSEGCGAYTATNVNHKYSRSNYMISNNTTQSN